MPAMSSREVLISKAKEGVVQLSNVLQNNAGSRGQCLPLARQIMSQIDHSQLMSGTSRLPERTWLIQGLQQFAMYDDDIGAFQEVARWCERQWNRILQQQSDNAAALKGLGKYWLYRAQPLLARIYDAEASVTKGCSAESVASGITNRALSAAANEDAWSPTLEQLRHRPEYVEARGLLNAATSFYARAVSNTPSSDPGYGYLLVETGKAFIHLGVVQTPEASLDPFLKALRVLQRAAQTPGIELPDHLQEYLQEYARYL